jgi:hypothetical protein
MWVWKLRPAVHCPSLALWSYAPGSKGIYPYVFPGKTLIPFIYNFSL